MPPDSQKTWREILAETLSEFFLGRPENVAEWFRRVAVVSFLTFASFSTFTVVRYPEWISYLSPRSIEERAIEERLAEDKHLRQDIFNEMERWFYGHRPHGLMLVSWHDLNALTGVWVRPRGSFPEKEGPHTLTLDMRQLAGPFVFGECHSVDSLAMPGKIMVACPIYTSFDVWGYVAAVIDPAETSPEYVFRSVRSLANRLRGRIYGQ
jgi:hypothetical protein